MKDSRPDSSEFAKSLKDESPSVPTDANKTKAGDKATRAGAVAAAASIIAYVFVGPGVGHEMLDAAVGAAALGAGVLAINDYTPVLCKSLPGSLAKGAAQVLFGGGAGAGFGVTVASAAHIALLAVPGVGVVTGGFLLAAGGTALVKYTARSKVCPGLLGGKQHPGKCSQRICRECFAMFVPDNNMKTLDTSPEWLTWYQVASYLQFQGLSFLDSLELTDDYGDKWNIKEGIGGSHRIFRSSFMGWLDREGKKQLVQYAGRGKDRLGKTRREINSKLQELGL